MKLKKVLFFFILLVIGFFIGTLIAKAQNTQKIAKPNIVGKWVVDKSILPEMVDEIIENVKKQDAQQAEQLVGQREFLEQMLGDVILEYKADNTYHIDVPNNPQSGTWKMSEDGKKIIRKDVQGKESVSEIVELTTKKMVVLNEEKKKRIYNAL